MNFNEATIQELKQILKEEYGKEINQEKASEIANILANYFDLLAKISCQINFQNKNEDNKPKDN